jgi:anti-sigma factor RsiW
MNGCNDLRPALGAYVLGALEPDEAAEVRRHIEDCPDCAAEHDSLAPLPELLSVAGGAEAATAEPLSPAFEERLLDAYARDRSAVPRRRRRLPRLRGHMRLKWMAAGAATAAIAAAAAFAVVMVTGGEDGAPRYNVAFENTAAAPGASARAQLESVNGGTELRLWVRGMEGDARAVYEVLCEAPEWTASAGTFRVNVSGRAYVRLNTAARRGEYDSIRVVRRARDDDGQIVTREVLRARLS